MKTKYNAYEGAGSVNCVVCMKAMILVAMEKVTSRRESSGKIKADSYL